MENFGAAQHIVSEKIQKNAELIRYVSPLKTLALLSKHRQSVAESWVKDWKGMLDFFRRISGIQFANICKRIKISVGIPKAPDLVPT